MNERVNINFMDTDKINPAQGECLIEESNVNDSTNQFEEFIDFEELIDVTRNSNNTEQFLQNIIDFEHVLSRFEIMRSSSSEQNKLSLDDINGSVENLLAENPQSMIYTDCTVLNNNALNHGHGDTRKNELDTISISSDDETHSTNSDGYNSSDFEFITEADAKMDGYVINFTKNDSFILNKNDIGNKNKSKIKGPGVTDESYVNSLDSGEYKNYSEEIMKGRQNRNITDSGEGHSRFNMTTGNQSNVHHRTHLVPEGSRHINYLQEPEAIHPSHMEESGHESDPGEGPSGLNDVNGYSNRDYRQNHVIPEGDGYLDLFQGPYNPILPLSEIILLENKSIRPSPMYVQYEDIGFDRQLIRRRYQQDSSEEEYEDEAKENIKKILSMYPEDNRKPGRRH